MDPIAAAIAAVDKPVLLRQIQITIGSTGRPAVLAIPADASDAEIAELAGWMLTSLLSQLRKERQKGPASRILVPRSS